MNLYSLAIREYLKGRLRKASEHFFKVGIEYLSAGNFEDAKKAFLEAAESLYRDLEEKKWRSKNKTRILRECLIITAYYILADENEKALSTLNEFSELRKHGFKGSFRLDPIFLLLKVMLKTDAMEVFEDIENLLYQWSNLNNCEKEKKYPEFLILEIAKNILLSKFSRAYTLLESNEKTLKRYYGNLWDLLKLTMFLKYGGFS